MIEHLLGARRQEVVVQFQAYLATERRPELREPIERALRGFEGATAQGLEAFGVAHPAIAARRFVAVIDGFALHRIAWSRGTDDEVVLMDTLQRLIDSFLRTPAKPTSSRLLPPPR